MPTHLTDVSERAVSEKVVAELRRASASSSGAAEQQGLLSVMRRGLQGAAKSQVQQEAEAKEEAEVVAQEAALRFARAQRFKRWAARYIHTQVIKEGGAEGGKEEGGSLSDMKMNLVFGGRVSAEQHHAKREADKDDAELRKAFDAQGFVDQENLINYVYLPESVEEQRATCSRNADLKAFVGLRRKGCDTFIAGPSAKMVTRMTGDEAEPETHAPSGGAPAVGADRLEFRIGSSKELLYELAASLSGAVPPSGGAPSSGAEPSEPPEIRLLTLIDSTVPKLNTAQLLGSYSDAWLKNEFADYEETVFATGVDKKDAERDLVILEENNDPLKIPPQKPELLPYGYVAQTVFGVRLLGSKSGPNDHSHGHDDSFGITRLRTSVSLANPSATTAPPGTPSLRDILYTALWGDRLSVAEGVVDEVERELAAHQRGETLRGADGTDSEKVVDALFKRWSKRLNSLSGLDAHLRERKKKALDRIEDLEKQARAARGAARMNTCGNEKSAAAAEEKKNRGGFLSNLPWPFRGVVEDDEGGSFLGVRRSIPASSGAAASSAQGAAAPAPLENIAAELEESETPIKMILVVNPSLFCVQLPIIVQPDAMEQCFVQLLKTFCGTDTSAKILAGVVKVVFALDPATSNIPYLDDAAVVRQQAFVAAWRRVVDRKSIARTKVVVGDALRQAEQILEAANLKTAIADWGATLAVPVLDLVSNQLDAKFKGWSGLFLPKTNGAAQKAAENWRAEMNWVDHLLMTNLFARLQGPAALAPHHSGGAGPAISKAHTKRIMEPLVVLISRIRKVRYICPTYLCFTLSSRYYIINDTLTTNSTK